MVKSDDIIDPVWLGKQNPSSMAADGFSKSEDREYIAETMQYVRENHVPLILVSEGGAICQKSVLINIADGSLQIDKPLEWCDEVDSFRVFFQDRHQRWNFFLVSGFRDNPFNLSIVMPNELHLRQRRSCPRVKLPAGTRALLKNGYDVMTTVLVYDLSETGMLMCNDPIEGEYVDDSIIKDIVVSIPAGGSAGEVRVARKVLPLIGRGRVVRSFVDQETSRPCYGVSFHYESKYVKETINKVVADIESDVFTDFSSSPN